MASRRPLGVANGALPELEKMQSMLPKLHRSFSQNFPTGTVSNRKGKAMRKSNGARYELSSFTFYDENDDQNASRLSFPAISTAKGKLPELQMQQVLQNVKQMQIRRRQISKNDPAFLLAGSGIRSMTNPGQLITTADGESRMLTQMQPIRSLTDGTKLVLPRLSKEAHFSLSLAQAQQLRQYCLVESDSSMSKAFDYDASVSLSQHVNSRRSRSNTPRKTDSVKLPSLQMKTNSKHSLDLNRSEHNGLPVNQDLHTELSGYSLYLNGEEKLRCNTPCTVLP